MKIRKIALTLVALAWAGAGCSAASAGGGSERGPTAKMKAEAAQKERLLKAEIARKEALVKEAKSASSEMERAKKALSAVRAELEAHLSGKDKGRGVQLAACPDESSCRGAGEEFYAKARLLKAKEESARAGLALAEAKMLLASEKVRIELETSAR